MLLQAQQPWYRGVDLRHHTVIGWLGSGGYGIVTHAVVELPDGATQRMAVKSLVGPEHPEHLLRIARREVDGMEAMQGSPHALQLYGSTFDYLPQEELGQPREKYQVLMELAEGNLTKELVSGAVACLSWGRRGPLPCVHSCTHQGGGQKTQKVNICWK